MALIATASGERAADRPFAKTRADQAGVMSTRAPASALPRLVDRVGALLRRVRQRARDRMLDGASQRTPDRAGATRCDVLRIVARRHF